MTANDFIEGKVICHKCLAMAALGVMTIGLGLKLFTPASDVFNHVGLISWLSIVMASTLYFVCANKASKKNDAKVVLKNGFLTIYENGRRKAAQKINEISADMVSCQYGDLSFKPAILLKGKKIGKVTIAYDQDQFDWLHFKTFIKKTEFVVDSEQSWEELISTFNSTNKIAA